MYLSLVMRVLLVSSLVIIRNIRFGYMHYEYFETFSNTRTVQLFIFIHTFVFQKFSAYIKKITTAYLRVKRLDIRKLTQTIALSR